jgi:PTH1 family peptidyl-tRNA hydrolase
MVLIVGLGNIGPKYQHTRHNIGFMALDKLAGETGEWREQAKLDAYTSELRGFPDILLAKPTTMMNSSGQAVGKLAQFYKIAPEDIWVVYDELDIPLGKLKIGTGQSDNGHNGLISISQRLGHNRFWRFRLGVDTRQHREIPGLEYVLQPFADDDTERLNQALDSATTALKTAIVHGPQVARQQCNKLTGQQVGSAENENT